MAASKRWKAALLGGVLVATIVCLLLGLSWVVALFLPFTPSLPVGARALGGGLLLAGVIVAAWTFRHRAPSSMIVSTYYTIAKALRLMQIDEMAGRVETLVVKGPQKYVRNPLYLSVVTILLGWGLLAESLVFLVAAVVFLIWFVLFLIPFEERELRALFGEGWVEYMRSTPMLIPFSRGRQKRPRGSG